MILYLGTSSLIQLYADEPDSEAIRGWVRAAEIVATCRIAYTEVMAAVDLRFRKGHLTEDDYNLVSQRFSEDWERIVKVDFDDYEAGRFVKQYGLTRFGALHLSAAKLLVQEYDRQRAEREGIGALYNGSLFFLSVDEKLCKAAASEGLRILPSH